MNVVLDNVCGIVHGLVKIQEMAVADVDPVPPTI